MIITSFVLRTISIYCDRGVVELSFEVRKELYSTVQYILSFASCFAVLNLLEAMSQSEDISVLIIMIDRMVNDLSVFVKIGLIIVLGFTTSFVGLEWVGATRLGDQTLAEQNKDIQPDDMGYGTSFGFRLPGHFFSPADEVKPALFVPLWGFLGEVSWRCTSVVRR